MEYNFRAVVKPRSFVLMQVDFRLGIITNFN